MKESLIVLFLSRELWAEVSQIVYVADQIQAAMERSRLLLPVTFTRYFTWGYPDHSARIALVEEDRVRGRGKGEIRVGRREGGGREGGKGR